jgi:hypothetical protein
MRADEARSLSRAPRACVAVHACLVGSEPVWLGGRLLGCCVFALPGTRPAVACCRACSTAAARAREGAGEGLTPISSTLPPPPLCAPLGACMHRTYQCDSPPHRTQYLSPSCSLQARVQQLADARTRELLARHQPKALAQRVPVHVPARRPR